MLRPLLLLRGRERCELGEQLVDVDARVPEVEVAHPGVAGHRLPVGASDGEVDRLSLLVVEAAVATGDGEARGEPLHVPLERAGMRLVEVVDAEDEPPVGRGERPEVRQVRIAAELTRQTRPRHAPRGRTPSGRPHRDRT